MCRGKGSSSRHQDFRTAPVSGHKCLDPSPGADKAPSLFMRCSEAHTEPVRVLLTPDGGSRSLGRMPTMPQSHPCTACPGSRSAGGGASDLLTFLRNQFECVNVSISLISLLFYYFLPSTCSELICSAFKSDPMPAFHARNLL